MTFQGQQTARREFGQATNIFPKIIKLIDISLVYLLATFVLWEASQVWVLPASNLCVFVHPNAEW
jgi:hypothetical protein